MNKAKKSDLRYGLIIWMAALLTLMTPALLVTVPFIIEARFPSYHGGEEVSNLIRRVGVVCCGFYYIGYIITTFSILAALVKVRVHRRRLRAKMQRDLLQISDSDKKREE